MLTIKVGDTITLKGISYEVERKISKPYALTRLKRLVDGKTQVVPTYQLLQALKREAEEC